ncbi:MAG: hypothetical protein OK457_05830 [Thaumarchaeota archaeon]|nr:hypothetical protein [Nitrososphaerota archaeon]
MENEKEKANLKKMGRGIYELREVGGEINRVWTLTNNVDGERRPFSMFCFLAKKFTHGDEAVSTGMLNGRLNLKIRNHIFFHGNNFYSIGEVRPDGTLSKDSFSGPKYITRLVNFPFSHIDQVDEATMHQLKKHRGVAVGEIYGLGKNGYHLELYQDELAEVGLQLTASTYLMYTTR